jgi:DNA-binding transcriptional LysR family regulator
MARLLTSAETVLVASPGYLARHGLPTCPVDLSRHQLLAFSSAANANTWVLEDEEGVTENIAVRGALTTDAIPALHAAALAGAGIAAFTERTARPELMRGGLVRVLPNYRLGVSHYYALYPFTRHLSPRARAFIDFMAGYYRGPA